VEDKGKIWPNLRFQTMTDVSAKNKIPNKDSKEVLNERKVRNAKGDY
jgi:hypothetical protein